MATTKKKTADGQQQNNKLATAVDAYQINSRILRQVSELLTQLEDADSHATLKERIAALVAISRIQVIFVALRKEKVSDADTGSAVKRYASAFKNDAGRREKTARPEPEPAGDWFEHADIAPDDDSDDAA